jgi:hypothetical protein
VAATAQLATEQFGASGGRLMMFVLERTASAVSWREATSEDRDTRRTIGSTSHRRPPGISRLSAIRDAELAYEVFHALSHHSGLIGDHVDLQVGREKRALAIQSSVKFVSEIDYVVAFLDLDRKQDCPLAAGTGILRGVLVHALDPGKVAYVDRLSRACHVDHHVPDLCLSLKRAGGFDRRFSALGWNRPGIMHHVAALKRSHHLIRGYGILPETVE